MRNSNFRATIFSAVAGIALGLAMFLSFGYTQTTVADSWCPDTATCTGGYCFTRGDGQKSCKYFQSSCNGGACTAAPSGGGDCAGGICPEIPTEQ